VTSREGIPQISNASTSPTITGLDDKDFLFRSVPSDASGSFLRVLFSGV